MRNIDRGEKAYLSKKSRYAGLWNGGVFHGEQIIRPEELEDMNTVQAYKRMRNAAIWMMRPMVCWHW